MKKFLLFCTLFLCLLFTYASDLTVMLENSSCTYNLRNQGFSYQFSIKYNYGGYTLSAPPVFSFNRDNWYLGEIRPSGLFRYLSSPSESKLDFERTKPFQKVYSPAVNPDFVGLGYSAENLDFAAFLPFGAYFDVGSDNLYFGTLFLYSQDFDVNRYMPYWQDIKQGGLGIKTITGFKKKNISAFYQCVFSESFGMTGSIGWNFDTRLFEAYGRISNTDSQNPMSEYGFTVKPENLYLGFCEKEYQRAIYGGTAQKIVYEYTAGYKDEKLDFGAYHRASSEEDTGRLYESEYNLKYKCSFCSVNCALLLERRAENGTLVKEIKAEITYPNAAFCIINTKLTLNVSLSDSMVVQDNIIDLKFSVNQDRTFSLSAKLHL